MRTGDRLRGRGEDMGRVVNTGSNGEKAGVTLKEILAAAREKQRRESGRRGGYKGGQEGGLLTATDEVEARDYRYVGTETDDARVGR